MLAFAVAPLWADEKAEEKTPGLDDRLSVAVARYLEASGASVGIVVRDLRTGKDIYAYNDTAALIPASNQKLLTGAFALERLGADYEFATAVYKLGDDLVVIGDFDPILGDPRLAERNGTSIYAELDRWAQAAREAFGEAIPGDLVVATRSEREHMHHPDWTKKHRASWYGAPAADLNFHDNCFDVTFRREGEKIVPVVRPQSRYIRVIDKTKPGKRQLWRLISKNHDGELTVAGEVKTVSSEPLSSPASDPPVLLGRVLADRLTRAGVGIKGQLVRLPRDEVNLDEAKRVAETRTPIAEVFHRSNKRSLNLAADCLLLRAGDGTWAGSAEAMHATLVERFGLDGEKLTVRDGSGLSRQNRVSARNLAILLEELAYRPDGRDVLLSLPRSGVDGSLRKRLKGPARGRVAAKTGTIAGAASLSGYVLDGENRVAMAFSILVNRPRTGIWRARAMADGLCRIMVEHLDDQARAARIADTAEAVKPEESVEASTSADSRY